MPLSLKATLLKRLHVSHDYFSRDCFSYFITLNARVQTMVVFVILKRENILLSLENKVD